MHAMNEDRPCGRQIVQPHWFTEDGTKGGAAAGEERRPIWGGLGIAIPVSGALWVVGYLVYCLF